MKKLLTAIFALILIGLFLNSCKKDDTASENFITIEGTFTVGNKTFTNPTFDLGKPELHEGRLYLYDQISEPDGYIRVRTPKGGDIELADGFYLYYSLKAYTTVVGETDDANVYVEIFNDSEDYFEFRSTSFTTKITKIGEVGDYIEGTYQGTLINSSGIKPEVVEYPVKGKFKVVRTPDQIPL